MSHIVEAKTRITYPNLREFLASVREGPEVVARLPFIALLRQAVLLVAREHEGKIDCSYQDYFGARHTVNTGLALFIPSRRGRPTDQTLPCGIGMQIDEATGVLTFVGDPYGVEAFYKVIQGQIVQRYATLAYMAVMRQEQYDHITTRTVAADVVVSGEVRYA